MINKNQKERNNPRWASHSHFEFPHQENNQQFTPNTQRRIDNPRANTDGCENLRIVNPENEHYHVGEETLKKLIDMNQNYLIEKIKVSDVPTPPKYIHKVPSKTGQSEYFLKYGPKGRGKSVSERVKHPENADSIFKMSGSPITGYQSTYHMDFVKKRMECSSDKKEKAKSQYERSDAPTFHQTSYKHDFGSIAPSPTASAKRVEVKLMGGGKLLDDTTYKQYYRLRTEGFKAPQPVIQKDNRIFMTLNQPQKSSYKQTFKMGGNASKKAHVDSCKPKQKYNPTLNKLKYRTEYREEFVKQAIAKKKVFECLSPEELKNYVMTILND